jgi:hypothetical protein
MLSGIGPADHLKYHGIPVKVDLPVGYGMQSHVGVGELIFTVEVIRHSITAGENIIKTLIILTGKGFLQSSKILHQSPTLHISVFQEWRGPPRHCFRF